MSNPGTGSTAAPDPKVVAELTAALTAAIQAMQQPAAVGAAQAPVPERVRAARDFDVLRGLLGQAGGLLGLAPVPQPVPMSRTKDVVVVDTQPPDGASVAVVQAFGGLEERVAVPTPRPKPLHLKLTTIDQKTPISRVELLDAKDQLVAFGPFLPAI